MNNNLVGLGNFLDGIVAAGQLAGFDKVENISKSSGNTDLGLVSFDDADPFRTEDLGIAALNTALGTSFSLGTGTFSLTGSEKTAIVHNKDFNGVLTIEFDIDIQYNSTASTGAGFFVYKLHGSDGTATENSLVIDENQLAAPFSDVRVRCNSAADNSVQTVSLRVVDELYEEDSSQKYILVFVSGTATDADRPTIRAIRRLTRFQGFDQIPGAGGNVSTTP